MLKQGINKDFNQWIKERFSRQNKRFNRANVNLDEEELVLIKLKRPEIAKKKDFAAWNKVSQDVLRPPRNPVLLASLMGSGA